MDNIEKGSKVSKDEIVNIGRDGIIHLVEKSPRAPEEEHHDEHSPKKKKKRKKKKGAAEGGEHNSTGEFILSTDLSQASFVSVDSTATLTDNTHQPASTTSAPVEDIVVSLKDVEKDSNAPVFTHDEQTAVVHHPVTSGEKNNQGIDSDTIAVQVVANNNPFSAKKPTIKNNNAKPSFSPTSPHSGSEKEERSSPVNKPPSKSVLGKL